MMENGGLYFLYPSTVQCVGVLKGIGVLYLYLFKMLVVTVSGYLLGDKM